MDGKTTEKKYRKTVLQVTVLHPIEDDVEGVDLAQIASEMDDGDWVGGSEVVSRTDLDADEVVPELKAVGNDGGFFAAVDGDAEAADDDVADGG